MTLLSSSCAESQESLTLDWLELLLASRSRWGTNNELCLELPALGDLPLSCDLLVDQWVVVLEVCAETLSLEGGPDGELMHAARLGGPLWEAVGVDGEFVLEFLCDFAVDVEKDLQRERYNVSTFFFSPLIYIYVELRFAQ